MTRDEIVKRALSAVGKGTIYGLGAGGKDPAAPHPADAARHCDCSGFVSWCCGTSRHRPDNPELKHFNGGWLSTSGIEHQAAISGGLFGLVHHAPQPGDLLVYGDYAHEGTRRQGHCGVLVEVPADATVDSRDWIGRAKIAHCSVGNDRRGDAIGVTLVGALFVARGTVVRWVG